MKRDMDLVRDILLAVEERDTGAQANLKLDDLSDDSTRLNAHLVLLKEAGLIEASIYSAFEGPHVTAKRLTWSGHEFVDSVRDPEVWKKTKSTANEVGSFSIELLGEIAKGFVKTKLKKHTGVEF